MPPDDFRDRVKAALDSVGPRRLCELLQRTERSKPQAGDGLLVLCPWHSENEPSCSVHRHSNDGGIAVKCHACGAAGDALSLVAGCLGLDPRTEFPLVLTAAHVLEGRGGWKAKRASVFVGGKHYYATVESCDPHTDVAWLRLDDAGGGLPYAMLADEGPRPGQKVWHKGHSPFRDGKIERGGVTRLGAFKGFAQLNIYSRSGDSGAAFFCEETGRVVCTLYGGDVNTRTDFGPTAGMAAKIKPR